MPLYSAWQLPSPIRVDLYDNNNEQDEGDYDDIVEIGSLNASKIQRCCGYAIILRHCDHHARFVDPYSSFSKQGIGSFAVREY